MNRKHIKVAYTSRLSGGSYTQVPKIQMEGRWLEELGFSIGNTIVVEYGEGSLCIRPMTETELAEKQRREAQKELDSKASEIRSLQFRLGKENQELKRVAEPQQEYIIIYGEATKRRRWSHSLLCQCRSDLNGVIHRFDHR